MARGSILDVSPFPPITFLYSWCKPKQTQMNIAHCDGTYETPDGHERSYLTLHLYLNDSADGAIGGGATTFRTLSLFLSPNSFSPSAMLVGGSDADCKPSIDSMNMKRQYDVLPKVGRVLVFQHRGLLHSGADVTSGVKLTLRTDLMYQRVAE